MAVQPFGEGSRGRGRGRGGFFKPRPTARDTPEGTDTDAPPSGARTPATGGLGYHVSAGSRLGVGSRRTPGVMTPQRVDSSGVVFWGGHGAPLFVKAGELFKDGEVDVVKRDGGECPDGRGARAVD